MEMSGFSETQLQVREAVGKICEDFPDVGCLVSFASLSWVSLRICALRLVDQLWWRLEDPDL
jgi:hypothetical protein